MIPAARHQSIVDALRRQGPLPVGDLARVLDVSPSTIRRDLSLMEAKGFVQRTFGGAILSNERDDPFEQVAQADPDAKRDIAAAAARLVPDGATVILDIGTSCLALAHALCGRQLTVVTASLPVFLLLADDPDMRLHLLGGDYRSEYRCTSGNTTVDGLRDVHADVAFMGCSGLASDGTVRDTTLDQVAVKRAIGQSSDLTVLLAAASKFPGKGSYAVMPAASLSHIVTDRRDMGDLEKKLKQSGTKVTHT